MNIPHPQTQQRQEEEEDHQEKPKKEWHFTLSSSTTSTHPHSDVIGAVALHPSGSLLASAGISRKIRLYDSSNLSSSSYISSPAKLSSLKFTNNAISAGDYDGVVTEYDLETRVPISERDEHGGRRVWSIDHSPSLRLSASASDDCTAHLWDASTGAAAHVVRFRAPVCSARFEETGNDPYIAMGCADRNGYVYDVRKMDGPIVTLEGHGKAVSYVRFAGRGRMVTSSVDGCHRMWDMRVGECERVYEGHENRRSFVGMDVCRTGGLIGCGSESDEVYVYDMRWGEPVWKERVRGEWVSAVCWKEVGVDDDECVLYAGGSGGDVRMFVGRRDRCDD